MKKIQNASRVFLHDGKLPVQEQPPEGPVAREQEGSSALWQVAAVGAAVQWIATAGEGSGVVQPTVARRGGRLVFVQRALETNIWAWQAAGTPQPLITSTRWDSHPDLSPDGSHIAFVGTWQIWSIPAGGGDPLQVTKNGGYAAFEAPGGVLYYVKREAPGIWRMPSGGPETRVVDTLEPYDWGNWAVTDDGIYFIRREASDAVLAFYDFATGSERGRNRVREGATCC